MQQNGKSTGRFMLGMVGLGVLASGSSAWVSEPYKVLAPDGAADDQFGRAVAISGNLLLVGAPRDDDLGIDSGSVYVFDMTTGAVVRKLHAEGGDAGDRFGVSIAVDGDMAVIGAHLDDEVGTYVGAAYLFDVATGEQMFKWVPPEAEHLGFGLSVALGEGYAVVGAPYSDSEPGIAWVFDATTGQALYSLQADTPTAWDQFGQSVAVSNGKVLVGGPYVQVPIWRGVGALFEFDAATGVQMLKFWAEPAQYQALGWSMAVDDGVVLAGSYEYADDSDQSGAAFLFDLDTGAELHKMSPPMSLEEGRFGNAVAISGGVAVVGAANFDLWDSARRGWVFLYDMATGDLLEELCPGELLPSDHFGESVALVNGVLAVGAPGRDDGISGRGAVYLYGDFAGFCRADMNGDGTLDFADVQVFLNAYAIQDSEADFASPFGVFNFFDVQTFLRAFAAGCP